MTIARKMVRARTGVELLEDRCLLTVFGADDRWLVTNTLDQPYRAIGMVVATFPSGMQIGGTATLIGPSHALTAGHLVFNESLGGWATSVEFSPARTPYTQPFGSARATFLRSYGGWTRTPGGDVEQDLALITLDKAIGHQTGWLGVRAQSDAFFQSGGLLDTAGYPTDRQGSGQAMYAARGPASGASSTRVFFDGTLDAAPGQSGSPMFANVNGQTVIAAVLNAGNATTNMAVRLTSQRIADLEAWMRDDQANATSASYNTATVAAQRIGGPAAPAYVPPPPPASLPAPASPPNPVLIAQQSATPKKRRAKKKPVRRAKAVRRASLVNKQHHAPVRKASLPALWDGMPRS